MGWWAVERSGEELLQGDEPYDTVAAALAEVTRQYEADHGRKPTLQEVLCTFEAVLASSAHELLADGERTEILEVVAKTRRRRKAQPFQVGDLFAIPLPGERYAFGRILADAKFCGMGWLVGIFAWASDHVLPPEELIGRPLMFWPIHCDDEAWRTWRWRIIASVPMQPGEFQYPKYKEGARGAWWIRDGDRHYPATADEVKDLEYATLVGPEGLEHDILQHLERDGGAPSQGPARRVHSPWE